MVVSFKNNQITCNEQTLNAVAIFIECFCKNLEYPAHNIKEIIFADNDNYGNEIKRIQSDEDYTHDEQYTGVGKVLYINSERKNVIIINSIYFEGIVNLINYTEKKDYEYYIAFLHIKFTICHEIGHCITHTKNQYAIKPIYSEIHDTYFISKYYFEIFVDEYLANRNIENIIFIDDIKYLIQFFSDEYNELNKKIKDRNNSELLCLAYTWRLYIRLTNFVAFIINKDIENYRINLDAINFPFDIYIFIDKMKLFSQNSISEDDLFDYLYITFQII